MKKILILIFFFYAVLVFSQEIPKEYMVFTKEADSLYKKNQYEGSALMYHKAFQLLGGKGKINDRYKAACSWAMANYPDSAFFNLDRISSKLDSASYEFMKIEKDLKPLHKDKRWKELIEKMSENGKVIMSAREIVGNRMRPLFWSEFLLKPELYHKATS